MYSSTQASKILKDSMLQISISTLRSEQTKETIRSSKDAIADLIIAASNYRYSTKPIPSVIPDRPLHNMFILS